MGGQKHGRASSNAPHEGFADFSFQKNAQKSTPKYSNWSCQIPEIDFGGSKIKQIN